MIHAFIATILNSVIITGMLKGGIHLVDWAMDVPILELESASVSA